MKLKASLIITVFTIITYSNVYAEEAADQNGFIQNSQLIIYPTNIYADASENLNNVPAENNKSSVADINWHKVFGWSTLGMAIVTFSSGGIIPENGHCPLAGVTTGLAAATCITGYYQYGGIISFANGDWKYNTHAILGTVATIGFAATLALAGEDGSGAHVATGAVSGAAFAVTLGVLYF